MATDLDLPQAIRYRGREYLREARYHSNYLRNQAVSLSLGNDLRGAVSRQMTQDFLENIWCFRQTSYQFREDVANLVEPHFYERREVVQQPGKLCVVEHGSVGRAGRVLVPWAYWGEDFILRDESLRSTNISCTLTYSEIVTLSRESLCAILPNYPKELGRFRRVAACIALTRAANIYYNEKKKGGRDKRHQWIHNLFDDLKASSTFARQVTPDADISSKARGRGLGETSPTIESQLERIIRMLGRTESRLDRIEREGHAKLDTRDDCPWRTEEEAALPPLPSDHPTDPPATHAGAKTGHAAPFRSSNDHHSTSRALRSSCTLPPPLTCHRVCGTGTVTWPHGGRHAEDKRSCILQQHGQGTYVDAQEQAIDWKQVCKVLEDGQQDKAQGG
eukprot:gnl/TRDRNA2_/TRDRNA2_176711_c15_seq1.p1 gnl/TRDRNA2_/TRDRNA2_176711_c15~~gnl/TRDRNA2_/TRDRNA2_176711_c15_seq1.p1  ORF type:complete len:413 (+),score=30.63 gnl/TRDRNA2_/TRDRNA2_176711_c15_seq1:68-1240(+)